MSAPPATIATRVRERALTTPRRVALREKHRGLWREITWESYWDQVLAVAHGLLDLGIAAGDRVAVHSENRPEWLYTDVAALAVRAVTVGVYPTNPAAEVGYLLRHSGARILVAEDQEQVDKALEVADSCPDLERIVYLDGRGIRSRYHHPKLLSWDELLTRGAAHRAAHPAAVDERMSAATGEDVATLVYTSGTTGPPKGAMLTNANVEFALAASLNGGSYGFVPGARDLTLSYLPLCHVAERMLTTWYNAGAGVQVNFAESIDTVAPNLREVQPTILFGVPRIWEKILAGVTVGVGNATPFKRLNGRLWLRAADRIGHTLAATGGRHTPGTRLLYAIGWVCYFRALRERIGMRHVRHALSGAAPISPEVLRFFMGIGVRMHEVYGMTENTAVATANRPGQVRLGTVGVPLDGAEVRVDPATGEIQTRHPAVFAGYFGDPEATARALTDDGWLRTGDVGEFSADGYLRITDRVKDILITAGGKKVAPSEIENALKASPYVKEAVVFGDRQPYLVALIGIEQDTVADWAQRRRLPFTTYRDLSEKPEVVALVQETVDRVNALHATAAQLKKFRLLPKELDENDGELTATQKVKRRRDRRALRRSHHRHVRRCAMTEAVQIVSRGLTAGSVYALLALGFVIIYSATRVISFAQPALMLAGAVLVTLPRRRCSASSGRSPPGALLTAGLALVVERVAVRPDARPAGVHVSIITLGVDVVIRVGANAVIGVGLRQLGDPWGLSETTLLGVEVQQRSLVAVTVTALVIVALFVFFRYSRTGLAMRAAADRPGGRARPGRHRRRRLRRHLGHRGGAWRRSGGTFAAVGGSVDTNALAHRAASRCPSSSSAAWTRCPARSSPGSSSGLAQEIPPTYQHTFPHWLGGNVSVLTPFAVMILVLLVRPLRPLRHPGGGARMNRPLMHADYAADMALLNTRTKQVSAAALLALALTLPFLLADPQLQLLATGAATAIGIIGLNLVTGYAGQVSLGHAFFLAIGAYTAAALSGDPQGRTLGFGITNMLIWLPLAGLVAAAVGALVAPLAVRLRGLYLAVVTLGLVFAGGYVFGEWRELTGGSGIGRPAAAPELFGVRLDQDSAFFTRDQQLYWLMLVLLVVFAVAARNVARSRVGRAFAAIRDRDIAAGLMGINLARYKTIAFALSSFYAGCAGALLYCITGYLTPDNFNLALSVLAIAMVLVGGAGTISGAVLGAFFFTLLSPLTRTLPSLVPFVAGDATRTPNVYQLETVAYGALIVLFLIFEPRGLYGLWHRLRTYWRSWPFSY